MDMAKASFIAGPTNGLAGTFPYSLPKLSRNLFLVAGLILIITYFVPIWSISLDAPQYPEGIGMYIYLDTIVGHNPHDLVNINGLNHYIGMKEIVPDSIPELKFMPFIIGFMILLALIVFAVNKRFLAWNRLDINQNDHVD